jgi:hypothetical protein
MAVFPILPVAVLLVRTKPQGDSGHEQSVNERQTDAEEGGRGTHRGEVEVKPSKDWRRPVPGDAAGVHNTATAGDTSSKSQSELRHPRGWGRGGAASWR